MGIGRTSAQHDDDQKRGTVTAPKQAASTAQEQAGAVAGTAKEQAASVASTASSSAAEVTGTAKEQAGAVVNEAIGQAQNLTGQVRQQVGQQVGAQTDKATSALRDLSRQLSEGDTSGVVGTVLSEVGQRVQGLADALEQKGPQGMVEDLRRYARRNPGSFLVSAALAGLVTGRLAKGMSSGSSTTAAAPTGPTGTAGGDPLAGLVPPSGVAGPAYPPPAPAPVTPPATFPPAGGDAGTYGGGLSGGSPYPGTTAGPSTSSSPYNTGYSETAPYGSSGSR